MMTTSSSEQKKDLFESDDNFTSNLPSLCESSLEDGDTTLSFTSSWDDATLDNEDTELLPATANHSQFSRQHLTPPTTVTTTHAASSNTCKATTPMTLTVLGLYKSGSRPVDSQGDRIRHLSSLKRNQIMVRQRVDGSESVLFEPEIGHFDSRYYNMTHKECGSGCSREILGERAILLQPIEHYQKLYESPEVGVYFDSAQGTEFDEKHVLDNPSFGEQVITRGYDASAICVGDIFVDEDGTLEIEVSSPRLCSAQVDKANGSPYGVKGVKTYANGRGLGGIFGRILEPGELRQGARFVRIANPNPQWTLERISKAMYGPDRPREYRLLGSPHWNGSKEELQELCHLGPDVLAQHQWREKADFILDNWCEDFPEKDKDFMDAACGGFHIEWLEPLLSVFSPSLYSALNETFDVACNGCCASYPYATN